MWKKPLTGQVYFIKEGQPKWMYPTLTIKRVVREDFSTEEGIGNIHASILDYYTLQGGDYD